MFVLLVVALLAAKQNGDNKVTLALTLTPANRQDWLLCFSLQRTPAGRIPVLETSSISCEATLFTAYFNHNVCLSTLKKQRMNRLKGPKR